MNSISTCPSETSSAIQKLAPELLAEIFLLCLPDAELWSMRSASQAPLLLGRVCSTWRSISHSIPAVWSHFSVGDFVHEMQESDYVKDAEALQVWIERYPISLTVIMDDWWFEKEGGAAVSDESFKNLLLAVIPYSSRWRRVDALPAPVFADILAMGLCSKNIAKLE
ncbi:hypothetical protein BD410DRAFT_398247 [Rickenella mellea]|uniref:F-box domain-containing protein n=1 Tax=Rickenella mellea TaxID=50990 RepID=A0A4Y7PY53_9AGAM|nr:hypothetical protein BD410DRAFT_398247 [Rickenella mellea]